MGSKIAYAHIAYKDTKKFVTIPITDVKLEKNSGSSIKPVDDTDFDKKKVYYVKWSNCGDWCEEDHEHFGYYPAFLMLLGENVEQIQTKIEEGRRLIIPNLKDCSESEKLQLEPPRKTKRTTLTKDTQTNKNKEILLKYNTQSFLSSRKSFVKNDSENRNEPEHTATTDERHMKDEDIKLKEELENSQNQRDALQKKILYLEEKSRIRQLTTITTETERAKVDSVGKKLFQEDDLRSDNENLILHEPSAESKGNPEGPRVLSNSRSKALPKLIKMQTANLDVKQRTGYKAEDDQRQNDNSEMMEDNLQEPGTSNTSRSKGMPKIISVQKVNLVKQGTRYEADEDQSLKTKKDEETMEASDNPQGRDTLKSSRSKGMPNCKSLESVNLNLKKRTQYKTEDDRRRRENERETVEANSSKDDENDSDGSNDPWVNRRVEPKMKRRKSDRMDPTLTRKILNDIQEALRHYEEQPDIDEYGREMYDVNGKKIYPGEGVEVSATAWFLIKHELFSDYLVEKNLTDEDKLKVLRKVPVLYTQKINYLRRKHYG